MLRFLMTILLMIACFFAGRISAQEINFLFDEEQIEQNVQQVEFTTREILELIQNQQLITRFPDLHRQLMILLSSPQIQSELQNPNRDNSPLFQKLAQIVAAIKNNLS